MHRPLRPALLAGAVATLVLATAGSAATKPSALQVPDPAGDAVAPGAGYDITGLTLTTTGSTETTSVRGRRTTTYTPKNLVVSLTLATPPATTAGSVYQVDVEVSGCGYANFSYTPGATLQEGSIFTECGSPADETGSTATLYSLPPKVSGSTITWTAPLRTLTYKPGARITDIIGYTTYNEPVFGLIGPTAVDTALAFDVVETDKAYVIG